MTEDERTVAVAHVAEYVQRNDYVTFAEIGRKLEEVGVPVQGEVAIEVAPNVIIWAGVSQEFMDIVRELRKIGAMHAVPASTLTYMIDGQMLNMPVAKRIPPGGYTKPHWAPVTFRPGRDPNAKDGRS